ncbi:MAG: hypothetical protein AB8G96_04740 [Phycisphaerales bacterium]
MNTRRFGAAAALVAACSAALIGAQAGAGPVWLEDSIGDAGDRPDNGQVTDGSGPLTKINGVIEGQMGPMEPDVIDLYLIRICDPAEFIASLLQGEGGNTDFDTQLWLFQPEGPKQAFGLLGNDDADNGVQASRLTAFSNDGSGFELEEPGRYWIGISVSNVDPGSQSGPIFTQETREELSGPDGQGAGDPLLAWQGPFRQGGNYSIGLQQVTFGGGPNMDCNCNGILDACDIAFGESLDENQDGIPDECGCPGDFDFDGAITFVDLVQLLANWGPCSGGRCPGDFNCNGSVGFSDLLTLLSGFGECP